MDRSLALIIETGNDQILMSPILIEWLVGSVRLPNSCSSLTRTSDWLRRDPLHWEGVVVNSVTVHHQIKSFLINRLGKTNKKAAP